MISNKVSPSNTSIGQPINSSTPTNVTSNSSTTINSTAGLEKGQVIRGEVVDLRSHEVSVKLEDGRLLTGKLYDTANLAIGDRVAFRVEDVSLKNLTLKIIADSTYYMQDNTIDKALDAAGLTKSSRNRAIVKELLDQQMSIDKKSIAQLIQQSIIHKDSSIHTLSLMNKYRIPITEVNISQFEAYRNGEQEMMTEIEVLADSMSELFSQMSNKPLSDYMVQSNELLNLILKEGIGNKATLQDGLSMNDPLTPNNNVIPIGNLLTPDERTALTQTLANNLPNHLISQDLFLSIQNGSSDIREVAHLLNQILDTEPSPTDLSNTSMSEGSTTSQTTMASSSDNLMSTILTAYHDLQYNNNDIGSFLPLSARMNLLKSLEAFSLSSELTEHIAFGDISSHDLLSSIQHNLNSVSESSIKDLFSSKEFKTLVQESLRDQWAFTPNSLTKEGEVEKHFNRLFRQLSELNTYLEQDSMDNALHQAETLTLNNKDTIASQANHLQDNINFMKTLNDLFTYIQLPLKLKNQNANSELYVYTRKKSGRTLTDGINVLLHLDMDHLGPLDIHIDLHNNNIVSKFYLDHEDTRSLISTNMPLLEQALHKKGYSLNVELLKRDKEIDMVEDFMKQDAPPSAVTRYKFDIRA